jgi:hypothetical protein
MDTMPLLILVEEEVVLIIHQRDLVIMVGLVVVDIQQFSIWGNL